MGLSSSQARLLNLTARMHQIEYKAARLEAMKLQMANESTRVYEDYLDAMDKTKIQIKTLNTDGSITYKDPADYDMFLAAGYAINWHGSTFDVESGAAPAGTGKLYKAKTGGAYYGVNDVPRTAEGAVDTTKVDEVSASWANLKLALGITSETDFTTCLTNIINSGDVTLVDKRKEAAFHQENDANINFADYETSVSTNTGLQEVTDEVNLRKAEAKYEADMKRIDLKDRKYDTDLAALETERNAIKQEIDTLKTVAKDNVERTFKLFS